MVLVEQPSTVGDIFDAAESQLPSLNRRVSPLIFFRKCLKEIPHFLLKDGRIEPFRSLTCLSLASHEHC